MTSIFLSILNMSLSASVVILAVLLLRLLLHRVPKNYSYMLWAVVGLRLACPFSFQSAISLFGLRPLQNLFAPASSGASPVFLPEVYEPVLEMAGREGMGDLGVRAEMLPVLDMSELPPFRLMMLGVTAVWTAGAVLMLLCGAVSFLRLRTKLNTAVRLDGNVWQSEQVRSPFILGVMRPKIYIPYGLAGENLQYVLTHERTHLQRGDHLVKMLAYLVLAVHWFNPLCWLAFYLMGRDMEMSCDEKVLERFRAKGLDAGEMKRIYSTSLLAFAVNRRLPVPSPLAFGESGVKARIKNILRWKKTKTWVSVCAAVLCIVLMAACAANPVSVQTDANDSMHNKADGTWEGTVNEPDDELTLSEDAVNGILLIETLVDAWNQNMWSYVIVGQEKGMTRVEKEEAVTDAEGQHYGNYSISGLQLAEDVLPAYAYVVIQPAEGKDSLSAVLLQPVENSINGAQISVRMEAEFGSTGEPEVKACRITLYPYNLTSSQSADSLNFNYTDLNLSEDMLQDMAACIYRNVPAYAVSE